MSERSLQNLFPCRTPLANSSDLQTHDMDVKIVFRADLPLQPLEGGAGELFDLAALEAGKMQVILLRLDFVIVFFAVEMHEIELVDHAQALEQFDGPVNCGAVDLWIAFAGQLQQLRRIQMAGCLLDRLDQRAALSGKTNSLGFYGVQQVVSFEHDV
jgi:hypothetical protein